ncbi:DUF485 domain-containing protein [Streptomyces sp. NPDC094437]|uniref:DUF485 domain-containing protein n=1 Tax=Streptomyces sp. NPDC094437 TaxID=3366060 RepID=UPI0038127EF9
MPHDSSELPAGHRLSPAWSSDGAPQDRQPQDGPHRTLRLLRRAGRRQRRVAALVALTPFALFLLVTVEVPSLMDRAAPGGLPTGLLLALAQPPVTWLAVVLYEWSAHRFVDPLVRRAREDLRDAEPSS